MKRGLVVGKFYPPHRGHKHLIEVGRSQVDQLTVIVSQKPGERPAGDLRAQWISEIHPDVRVMLIDDIYDEKDSRIWAQNSIRWLGHVPDLVFTSEDYGEEFARHLNCRHVLVDRTRQTVPVSGTKIRDNPLRYWEFLEPSVRAYYAKRICLVGAESTGKTTLAVRLADHYKTVWVPEYGREYSALKIAAGEGYDFSSPEFTQIAMTQCAREEAAARLAHQVLICDTDAFATSIWHRRYLGGRSAEVEKIAAAHRRPDLYLLTSVEVPFVQDGTRDGEAVREWMHETFVAELKAQKRPYKTLSGSPRDAFRQAVEFVDEILGERQKVC